MASLQSTKIFNNLVFYFIGVGSKRCEVFKAQIKRNNGEVAVKGTDDRITHVIIDESVVGNCYQLVTRQCKELRVNVCYVSAEWLVRCLKEKRLVETGNFLVTSLKINNKVCLEEEDVDKANALVPEDEPSCSNQKKHYAYLCSQPSLKKTKLLYNQDIISELGKLAEAYRATKDTWRLYSYEKAISAINKYNKEITTYQEAVAIPGVGEKIAEKIMELKESGSLRKVSEVCENEQTKTLGIFCQVWGAGPATAEAWYKNGCRSLTDLEALTTLSFQQKIGLRYFEDFQQRIPRNEVKEFGRKVEEAAVKVSPLLRTTLVGSYRRGSETCGDIDVMITNASPLSANEVLLGILKILKTEGIVTDDLTSSDAGRQRKWLGVGRLEEDRPYRRLDLFVVPVAEEAAALMHFTGSALFNRSARLLASKNGMCLTEHGLFTGTSRRGSEVVHEGSLLETPTEKDIFDRLGIPFRLPQERDH